ncbi:hypothetical protein H112_05937 [Trichophyton rubrum D6]|uniref:Uncharacterized protein n=1 Tax=Trichophyton soudanense CBS 452.61 TaxID=1215331 RepID=A0A022XMI8_TRISD|nr:hypothetical protein H100_05952 [Trichophyton rubrum MR850]EZF40018.1 hypothetical protein H102_05921 [Trichophyton rubrum CBS 100081]EZF61248.1 hypothetical protein H104_05934 [Trichophyton rubrum CBS 289.86]EZF71902.1 hypothetical protein H105_05961 [Trichophyton soudanense CBS 452.61]EZF82573.1 hypothetical protein H110_05943 [Trichophyton rubrum MR1448]EZG04102.1 hypothetical protein H106_05785 [Trichophyton rubrum CBS 735.88]EZG14830.1 hypothetical protein H107_06083 [Trichophyton rub
MRLEARLKLVLFECPKLLSPAGRGSGNHKPAVWLCCGAIKLLVAQNETLERRALMEYYTSTFVFFNRRPRPCEPGAMGRSHAYLSGLITFFGRTATCRPRISVISL